MKKKREARARWQARPKRIPLSCIPSPVLRFLLPYPPFPPSTASSGLLFLPSAPLFPPRALESCPRNPSSSSQASHFPRETTTTCSSGLETLGPAFFLPGLAAPLALRVPAPNPIPAAGGHAPSPRSATSGSWVSPLFWSVPLRPALPQAWP